MRRTVRAEEARDIICAWAEDVLDPACAPFSGPLPFERDAECDEMLASMAMEPAGSLAGRPQALLALARARVMFVIAMAGINPTLVAMDLDEDVPERFVLPLLISEFLGKLRVPSELRSQSGPGSAPPGRGTGRLH